MNLQSMSASRYCGPFFDKVQKWEKSLSLISEVVDVRNMLIDSTLILIIQNLRNIHVEQLKSHTLQRY